VQYRINLAAANWRMEKQNEILPRLQEQFEQSLGEGVILELDSGDVSWIQDELSVEDA
jgi:hypothetical protein